jgi:predicted glycosyltransferase
VSEPERPRLLVYSQDGLGLGHLRRTTLLVKEFLNSCPDATALTIADSPVGQFFSSSRGHDYLKLPSIRKAGPGDWRPVSMSMAFTDVLRLRREIIRSTVLSYRPHVLLVDHMPHGAMGELVPTLEALASEPVRVVLGLRDILDAPSTVRRRWRLEGAFESVERHYHDVLVYGSRDLFDVSAQYGWPADAASRLRYCGYVCSPPPSRAQARKTRRRYLRSSPGADLVVAMAGGGADGQALFATLLQAVPGLLQARPCVVVLVTGPFLPAAERHKLLRLARGLPVHVLSSVHDSLSYLGAADLVVGMAGYNTTAEILRLGKRAVLVPRSGPSEEQQIRAGLFAERGWIRRLPPESLSPAALSKAMIDALDAPERRASVPPDLGGRQMATQHLLTALQGLPGGRERTGCRDESLSPIASPAASDPADEAQQLLSGG